MSKNFINSENFDILLLKLLKSKKGKNIITGRFDIENIELKKKAGFIIKFILSIKCIKTVTYKILYWENDEVLKEFFNNSSNNNFNISISYNYGKIPGVIFVEDTDIDEFFLKLLLENHFNYEMAKEPALNLRIQVCINQEEFITVLDIYDDRGFDIFYLMLPLSKQRRAKI
ncbi:hypothetical protein [Emticicia fluvialis]|nr:hypothetical protein [Emticicia fluvialis]